MEEALIFIADDFVGRCVCVHRQRVLDDQVMSYDEEIFFCIL